MTESGKTTLARFIARELRSRGQTVAVFDPTRTPTRGGDWGDGALIFDQVAPFLAFMEDERTRRLHVFVDEADLIFNHALPENFWMATRGRHFGFSMNLISQRPTLIHPTVRDQCTRLYMFRLARSARVMLGQEKGHDDFDAFDLDQGEFVVANSASRDVSRMNLNQLFKD